MMNVQDPNPPKYMIGPDLDIVLFSGEGVPLAFDIVCNGCGTMGESDTWKQVGVGIGTTWATQCPQCSGINTNKL